MCPMPLSARLGLWSHGMVTSRALVVQSAMLTTRLVWQLLDFARALFVHGAQRVCLLADAACGLLGLPVDD